jgi:CRISPR system Cascade subunit CasE
MSTSLYLSRARLRSARGEALSAVAPILIPDDESRRAGHAHRLVWLLFQDIPDAARDFLWRDDGDGKYLILSKRVPSDPLGLFDLETKPFEPSLKPGDRLHFVLRANPVLTTKRAGTRPGAEGRSRGKRVDVVMDALFAVPRDQRATLRERIAAEAGARWFDGQGARAGFERVGELLVDGYTHIDIEDRERRRRRGAGISVLDFKGQIEITDAAAFVAKLAQGFGAAKAFGNGLMLIRRA